MIIQISQAVRTYVGGCDCDVVECVVIPSAVYKTKGVKQAGSVESLVSSCICLTRSPEVPTRFPRPHSTVSVCLRLVCVCVPSALPSILIHNAVCYPRTDGGLPDGVAALLQRIPCRRLRRPFHPAKTDHRDLGKLHFEDRNVQRLSGVHQHREAQCRGPQQPNRSSPSAQGQGPISSTLQRKKPKK